MFCSVNSLAEEGRNHEILKPRSKFTGSYRNKECKPEPTPIKCAYQGADIFNKECLPGMFFARKKLFETPYFTQNETSLFCAVTFTKMIFFENFRSKCNKSFRPL